MCRRQEIWGLVAGRRRSARDLVWKSLGFISVVRDTKNIMKIKPSGCRDVSLRTKSVGPFSMSARTDAILQTRVRVMVLHLTGEEEWWWWRRWCVYIHKCVMFDTAEGCLSVWKCGMPKIRFPKSPQTSRLPPRVWPRKTPQRKRRDEGEGGVENRERERAVKTEERRKQRWREGNRRKTKETRKRKKERKN